MTALEYRGVTVPADMYDVIDPSGFERWRSGVDSALSGRYESPVHLIVDTDGDMWYELEPGGWTWGDDRADAQWRLLHHKSGEYISQYANRSMEDAINAGRQ